MDPDSAEVDPNTTKGYTLFILWFILCLFASLLVYLFIYSYNSNCYYHFHDDFYYYLCSLFFLTFILTCNFILPFFHFEDPGHCTLTGTINDPKLWTAETPHLYILVISLYADLENAEKGERAIDVETCRVGVRDIQIAGGYCVVLCCVVS